MPSALQYIPPTDPQRGIFTREIQAERTARKNTYLKALEYYEGNQDDQLVVEKGKPDDNIYYNLVKTTCDRTIQFLFPELPQFVTDPESLEDTPEEEYLQKAMIANGGLAKLIKMGTRGFLAGHNFVRVKPVPKNRRSLPNQFPKMILLDPLAVTIFWNAEDDGDVLWYENRYVVGEQVHIQDYVQEADGTWMIHTYQQVRTDKVQKIFQQVHAHGRNHAFMDKVEFSNGAFIHLKSERHTSLIPPVIEWAHMPHPDSYYGATEFSQKKLQDMINRTVSQLQQIVRENSDPKDVILGADLDDVETGGGIITIAQAQAQVKRLELKGDMAGITAVLQRLIDTYLAVSRVVILKGEAKDLQRVTNAAVRTLFLDALAKNELLMSTYGQGISMICSLMLLMGYEQGVLDSNPSEIVVTVEFPTPLPVDMTEVANINALALNGGYMSPPTAARRLNLDWRYEQPQIDEQMQKNLENQREQMAMAKEFSEPQQEKENQDLTKPE